MEANDRETLTSSSPQEDDYIDLQQYWLILKRRWLPAVAIAASTVALAAVYSFQKEPIYEAKARLLLDKGSQNLALPGLSEGFGGAGVRNSILTNEAEIIRSIPIVEQVISRLGLINEEGEPLSPKAFLGQLEVSQVKDADILELSYESPDPEEAARVVDELMVVYRESDVATNRSEATAAREFIEEQLPKTEESVREAEIALQRFQEQNNIIALSEEAEETVKAIAEIDRDLIQARAALAEAETRHRELRERVGMPPEVAIAATTLSESNTVRELLAQYRELETQLELESTRYKSEHPIVLDLSERKDRIEVLLKQNIRSAVGRDLELNDRALQLSSVESSLIEDLVRAEIARQSWQSRVDTLVRERQAYQSRAQILPKLVQGQRELERQLNAAQSTYEALLQRLQEVRVAENQNLGNARVVETALVPEKPISPRLSLNLILGGVLGTLLGGGAAMVLDARDRTLKTVQEARDRLGLVMLGSIPLFHASGKGEAGIHEITERRVVLPVRDFPRSSISESFRMLQANLKFSCSDRRLKVIVVTSSVPKEGKSTVSANLGIALAELGNRVLVIDADMRRPSQHQVWEQPNTVGLSNVLVEQREMNSMVREQVPGLDVLTAGTIPPNPVVLLDSQRMISLIERSAEEYDYVIIDTPPLAVAADAVILGNIADGVLLVVRPGVAEVASINAAKETIKRSRQPILGMVVNGVNPKNEPDSYYYYYARGYYYADESESKSNKATASNSSASK